MLICRQWLTFPLYEMWKKILRFFFLGIGQRYLHIMYQNFQSRAVNLGSALHCGKAFNFLLVTSHNLKDFGISPLESGKGTFRICAIKTYISTYSPFERNFFKNSLLHRYYGYVAQCDFQFKK